jgi:hypothetical protein
MRDLFQSCTGLVFAGHLGVLAVHWGIAHGGFSSWASLVYWGFPYLVLCCGIWGWLVWKAGPIAITNSMTYAGLMRQFASPHMLIATCIEPMFCGAITSCFMGYLVYVGAKGLVFYHLWLLVAFVQLILGPLGITLYGILWLVVWLTGNVNYHALAIFAYPTTDFCIHCLTNVTAPA